ncbi:hypothetical protein AVEN_223591-1 [Araneus ventricosus]|uniref:Reverse transcriptase domain-containing protein n=1 Tax=Araneus ventricosus TaxID=182803 RepID=A0A4Y2HJD3_ARAVE|nr:hypothetical protein AVEN_223591-1 [Araneus ventricosus]
MNPKLLTQSGKDTFSEKKIESSLTHCGQSAPVGTYHKLNKNYRRWRARHPSNFVEDLLNCLEEDGISVYLMDVIKDFLGNRRIYDDINNTEFNYSKGVPQGSCLGPVLWLLIADRLLRQMDEQENIMCTMFEDDILIMSPGTVSYKFKESLVTPIKVVKSWANKYKLKINHTKSKFIMFPYKKDITHVPRLKMNDIVIKILRPAI